jgi:PAS domain S-box-containing protein
MPPKCFKCGVIFSSEQSLKYHLNKAKKCTALSCTKCEAVFSNESSLAIHKVQCENTLTDEQIRHNNYDLIVSSNSVIVEFDNLGKYKYISPNCFDIFGYTIEEFLSMKSQYPLIYENDLSYIISKHNDYINDNTVSEDIRYRKVHKDGSFLWIEATKPRFINEKVSVCIEKIITKQKQLEEISIRGLCADQMYDYFLECTDDGLIRYINAPFETMSGYTSQTIIGKKYIADIFDNEIVLHDGNFDLNFIMSNGLKIQVEAHIKKYNTEVYTIIFKKYEINKSELFRSFVHELRNPMNSLCQSNEIIELDLERLKKNNELLYLQLYEKTSFESTYKNQITAVCFIKNLLNDFLDFEKLQANTFVINQDEQCSISQIIDEVKNLITPFLFFEEKTIHYNCNNICDAKITIDKTRMCQIILNLLQNAIKYSIGNEIFLEINIISDKIVCSISHQGNIENSHIPNIFDPFYRVNISKNDGTGLGLFICKNIIDKMKGTISFLSDNCNIIAKFSIPVIIYNSCIENNTILIVDDFIGIRSTKTLLEIKGFKVDVVRSGEECIKKCKNTKYDIILMDKNMNGLSGIETVKILRESGYNGIIYGLTGDCLASVSESFDCSSNGVNNVIYKPLDINNLISMFQKDYINVLTQHK